MLVSTVHVSRKKEQKTRVAIANREMSPFYTRPKSMSRIEILVDIRNGNDLCIHCCPVAIKYFVMVSELDNTRTKVWPCQCHSELNQASVRAGALRKRRKKKRNHDRQIQKTCKKNVDNKIFKQNVRLNVSFSYSSIDTGMQGTDIPEISTWFKLEPCILSHKNKLPASASDSFLRCAGDSESMFAPGNLGDIFLGVEDSHIYRQKSTFALADGQDEHDSDLPPNPIVTLSLCGTNKDY